LRHGGASDGEAVSLLCLYCSVVTCSTIFGDPRLTHGESANWVSSVQLPCRSSISCSGRYLDQLIQRLTRRWWRRDELTLALEQLQTRLALGACANASAFDAARLARFTLAALRGAVPSTATEPCAIARESIQEGRAATLRAVETCRSIVGPRARVAEVMTLITSSRRVKSPAPWAGRQALAAMQDGVRRVCWACEA
jgi:hypothetical protein